MKPSDESQQDKPLLHDQRLVERVLRHWSEMSIAQKFPRLVEIDPWMLAGDWANCVIVKLDPAPATFMVIGDNLLPEASPDMVGKGITGVAADTVLGMTLKHLKTALSAKAPVKVEGAAASGRGVKVLFRSVLLPLSDDGKTVDFVLLAFNSRAQKEGENVAPFSKEKIVSR